MRIGLWQGTCPDALAAPHSHPLRRHRSGTGAEMSVATSTPPFAPRSGASPAGRHAAGAFGWSDAVFLAVVILFASDAFAFLGINSAVWLLCYAYMLLRLVTSLSQIAHALERNWPFLVYPALTLASALWSDVPVETLRFSLQLSMTVLIAVFLGSRFSARHIFRAFFAVTMFAMVVSILNVTGAIAPAYDGRGLFQGIFLSKNALGHRSVLFVLTCVFGIAILPGLTPQRRLAYVAGLIVAVVILGLSGSATGVLFSGAAGLFAVLLWLIIGWRGAWAFLAALIAGSLGLFVIASLFAELDPVSAVLGLVGRDPTLTGRTILWDFGWQHYLDRPWAGYGASGFWKNPDFASQIIALRQRYGDGVSGFHNLIVELLIMLGPVGVLAHFAMTAVALYRTLWHARHRHDPYAAWGFVIVIAIFGMSLLGPQYYQGHSIVIMLVVMLGTAFSLPRDAAQRTGNAARRARLTEPDFKVRT